MAKRATPMPKPRPAPAPIPPPATLPLTPPMLALLKQVVAAEAAFAVPPNSTATAAALVRRKMIAFAPNSKTLFVATPDGVKAAG